MTKRTEAEMEARYDAERSGQLYTQPSGADKPELPRFPRDGSDADVLRWREQVRQVGSPLFNDLLDWVDQHFAKEEAEATKPAETLIGAVLEYIAQVEADEATADDDPVTLRDGNNGQGGDWTECSAGDATLIIQHHGFVPPGGTPYMLSICGHDIDGPWTIAMLQQLHSSLGYLLSDDRVLSAVAGDEDAYTPCSPAWEAVLDITSDPTNDGREIPITRSRDQAHREERFLNILETIEAMEEPAKSEALGYAMGVFDGLAAADRPVA